MSLSTVFTEGRHTGEYIKSEANWLRSRDAGVLAAGSGICPAGTVLGQITASAKYCPMKEGATDGSQVAAAILYANTDATATDVAVTVTARDSEVFGQRLAWDASVNTPALLAAAVAALEAKDIIVR